MTIKGVHWVFAENRIGNKKKEKKRQHPFFFLLEISVVQRTQRYVVTLTNREFNLNVNTWLEKVNSGRYKRENIETSRDVLRQTHVPTSRELASISMLFPCNLLRTTLNDYEGVHRFRRKEIDEGEFDSVAKIYEERQKEIT